MEDSLRRKAVAVRGFAIRASTVAFVALFAGCSDSTGPVDFGGVSLVAPETIHFTTQSAANNRQIVVPVKITNSTSKVINRVYCSESLERFHGAGWDALWSPICAAIFSVEPIQPGATETILISIGDTPSQYSGFRFTDSENEYRMRLEIYVGGDDGTAALNTRAATNPFQVVP